MRVIDGGKEIDVARQADLSRVRILGMRMLCRKLDRTMTKGGVALPDTVRDSKNVLEVVLLGDGEEAISGIGYVKREFRVKVGECIVVDPRMVQPVSIEGETLAVVDEDAAMVVFEGDMEVS